MVVNKLLAVEKKALMYNGIAAIPVQCICCRFKLILSQNGFSLVPDLLL